VNGYVHKKRSEKEENDAEVAILQEVFADEGDEEVKQNEKSFLEEHKDDPPADAKLV